jgi:hypothetical protein
MPLFFLLVALSLTKNFRKNLFPVKWKLIFRYLKLDSQKSKI